MSLLSKNIRAVPQTAEDLINIVLHGSNRKTPTVVHPGFKISRIRDFYMTKVKFVQNEFHERLTQIIEDFPRLDAIHPFWASLINVVYDRDHYKLALGQIGGARTVIDNIGRDYQKYLKYGDSAFRCKALKKSAFGRMCTSARKLTPSLQYLEEIRQHLQRLPAIDPSAPTIILAGAPSSGKSSFMNAITRANVEVAAFPFTTKSLYLGHTDWAYLTWQVIDTPGLLDRALEERNTIEMQSVMAMVHLRAAILFLLDISCTSGYTIQSQVNLFHSLNEIFNTRPVTVVLTKTDLVDLNSISLEDKNLIESMNKPNVSIMQMSVLLDQGVAEVKEHVCSRLRDMRVEAKKSSKKFSQVENQLHVATPVNQWEPIIPVIGELNRPLQRELEEAAGGPGQYVVNTNEEKDLANPDWKNDIIPEIIEGRNVADFLDPNILENLRNLIDEEVQRVQEYEQEKEAFEENRWRISSEQEELGKMIKRERKIILKKKEIGHSKSPVPLSAKKRTTTQIIEKVDSYLTARGVDEETRKIAIEKIVAEKPRRIERHFQPLKRSTGVQKKGPGVRFDFYVKKNYVLEPKFLYSGKMGFKRDFK